jgi:ribonuclease J
VLRDRQHLAEDGIVIVAFAMQAGTEFVLSAPEITSRGFVYIKEADEMMKSAVSVVEDLLETCTERGTIDRNHIKSVVRDNLSDFFWKKTQRRPMILPMIIEIDE